MTGIPPLCNSIIYEASKLGIYFSKVVREEPFAHEAIGTAYSVMMCAEKIKALNANPSKKTKKEIQTVRIAILNKLAKHGAMTKQLSFSAWHSSVSIIRFEADRILQLIALPAITVKKKRQEEHDASLAKRRCLAQQTPGVISAKPTDTWIATLFVQERQEI